MVYTTNLYSHAEDGYSHSRINSTNL